MTEDLDGPALEVRGLWTPSGVRGPSRIHLEGERLGAVEAIPATRSRVVAMPAFANAHVHLELSGIAGEELPHSSFAEWVRQLVAHRRERPELDLRQAVRDGAAELLSNGTSAVGDIDSTGASASVLESTGLEGVCYAEVLGLPVEERWRQLDSWLGEATEGAIRRGLSPHAPYSTPESTYRRLAELAARRRVPVTTHVGETLEERDFLQQGRGPLARLFADWGIERPAWSQPGDGPVARVLRLGLREESLSLVHLNHLDADDRAALEGSRAATLFCPRSHAYFGHPRPHPVAESPGGCTAYGTDSRASNEGLDPWAELHCLARRHPGTTMARALEGWTRGGRTALGLPPAELEIGQPATFQLVDGVADPASLPEAAGRAEPRTVATIVRGRWAYRRPVDA